MWTVIPCCRSSPFSLKRTHRSRADPAVMLRSRSQQGLLRVSLQLHKWGRTRRRRRRGRAPQARGSRRRRRRWGMVWGGGVRAGEGLCPFGPFQKKMILALNMVSLQFWCILDGIFFYSAATCFTRKTGVIWCPSPFFILSLQKGPGSFS